MTRTLIRNLVEGIGVVGDEATLTYIIPMPNDGVTAESAGVQAVGMGRHDHGRDHDMSKGIFADVGIAR